MATLDSTNRFVGCGYKPLSPGGRGVGEGGANGAPVFWRGTRLGGSTPEPNVSKDQQVADGSVILTRAGRGLDVEIPAVQRRHPVGHNVLAVGQVVGPGVTDDGT